MACVFFVSRLTFCRKGKEKAVWIGIWVNASNSEINAASHNLMLLVIN